MNKPLDHSQQLTLVAIGDATGVILPEELLARLRMERGDVLSLVEGGDGFELRRSAAASDAEMAVMRDVMTRRRAALRELAK